MVFVFVKLTPEFIIFDNLNYTRSQAISIPLYIMNAWKFHNLTNESQNKLQNLVLYMQKLRDFV